jgi:hypothetical protein
MKLAPYLVFVVSWAPACGNSSSPAATGQAGTGGLADSGGAAGEGVGGGSAAGSSASGSAGATDDGGTRDAGTVDIREAGTVEMVSPGAHPLPDYRLRPRRTIPQWSQPRKPPEKRLSINRFVRSAKSRPIPVLLARQAQCPAGATLTADALRRQRVSARRRSALHQLTRPSNWLTNFPLG